MSNQYMKANTSEWLVNLKRSTPNRNNFLFASQSERIMNPIMSVATQKYIDGYRSVLATTSNTPQTMYDGMQTILNLCRVKSGYNPLDPEGTGDKAHFSLFTQNIASVPCFTLLNAQTKNIKQQSHNANDLINSFVSAFDGLAQQDVAKIENSVGDLVKAALSYAHQEEVESNFTQGVLQTGDDQVIFSLYASVFETSATNDKGIVTFKSEYTLQEAQYGLSKSDWENIKEAFSSEEKTSMEQWLSSMQTPVKSGSSVKALCLK
ncbi:hypothetical protein [Pectobacterium versatile]|uniref:hypothetical protein n=1 Tax=Pectobacterium versatile TaxID=2488639 RepID=UPI001CCE0D29|nr:hypothetical protein [Pectobacterium versatile]